MRLVGLTGGIGSGKSAAAARFREAGIPVLNADKIGHQLLEEGGAAVPGVLDLFGKECFVEGRIDRERLAQRAFQDQYTIQALNKLMHPLVAMEIVKQCSALSADGTAVVIVEAALLAEHGKKEDWMEGLILVTCPEGERIRRLVEGRSMRAEDARARIALQARPEDKLPLADWVIDNSSTLDHLHEQVDHIVAQLR